MLENRAIYDEYVESTAEADKGAAKLVTSLKRAIGETELRRMNTSTELLAGNPLNVKFKIGHRDPLFNRIRNRAPENGLSLSPASRQDAPLDH